MKFSFFEKHKLQVFFQFNNAKKELSSIFFNHLIIQLFAEGLQSKTKSSSFTSHTCDKKPDRQVCCCTPATTKKTDRFVHTRLRQPS